MTRDYSKGNMVLIADFSQSMTQVDKDYFSDEETYKSFEHYGNSEIKMRKLRWGPYPVMIA